jgi:pimeloyl-ACP methyl ester carboxylesterase/membrane-associated phospholipid phosphatase
MTRAAPVVHDLGGTGPTLILAHATGFHGRVWEPFARAVADEFHCLAIDFSGHGDTPLATASEDALDWTTFRDDVLATLDRLVGDGPVFGVGHSKGGAALILAEEARPGSFASLYLFEPIVFPRRPPGSLIDPANHPLAVGARKRREVFASRDEAYDNYAAKPPLAALHPDALRAYVDHGFEDLPDGTVRLKCRPFDEAATYAGSTSHDAFDHLDLVTCPVTVAGGDDGGAPALNTLALAEALPVGRLEILDGVGHFGPLEDPDRLASHVLAAFAGSSSETPLPPIDPSIDEPVAASVASSAPTVGHAMGRFDAEVDRAWDRLRGVPAVDRFYYSASALGDWSLIWHLLGAAQGAVDRRHGWNRVARLSASLGVESALVNGAIKSLFRRTRPVHEQERPHRLRMPATSSFPSGHASSAFMAARILSDRSRFGPAWYAVAAVVATSRVHVRIHHASDVIGGAVLGVVLGEIAVKALPLPED